MLGGNYGLTMSQCAIFVAASKTSAEVSLYPLGSCVFSVCVHLNQNTIFIYVTVMSL